MICADQSEIRALLSGTGLPRMGLVAQRFATDEIEDVPGLLRRQLEQKRAMQRIRPGMRIALTGGSREIDRMPQVLRTLVQALKEAGASPFLVPAMGSHGGGTAEGQREVLAHLGITPQTCGCPIHSSMETVQVGSLADGSPVRMDAWAHGADGIIVVGRIKAHTAFRGPYESGLIKMMAIGLGKQAGAESLHGAGYRVMAERLPAYARVVYEHSRILLGVGLIENEAGRLCRIQVLGGEEIFEEEPALLSYARTRMPRLLLPKTDVLVVGEIGKNFSGAGMDPNVTGTFSTPYARGGIRKQRTVVLGLSEESGGNFLGLGMADITTRRVFSRLEPAASYLNAITDKGLEVVKIPMVLETDQMALQAAVRTLVDVDPDRVEMVLVKNTHDLQKVLVSEALYDAIRRGQVGEEGELVPLAPPAPLPFGEDGSLALGDVIPD